MQEPITALDGRYQKQATELAPILSEFGLMRYRVQTEIAWLSFLKKEHIIPTSVELGGIETLEVTSQHYARIKELEVTTRHDVKAVEYFLREHSEKALWPWIHFACTSEDINNFAYAFQLHEARAVIADYLQEQIIDDLKEKAHSWKAVPMLSRTHGQPATPTTIGKEVAVYAHRLAYVRERLLGIPIMAKINGAAGNFAAHTVAFPDTDWIVLSERFSTGMGFAWNPLTTQIENHDTQSEVLDRISGLCSVLTDLCSDMWGYISIGYFGQKVVEGEIGSSTMPHKINPIDFENARGNCKLARGIARTLSDELPISMWQRDLSDSTLQRNLGLVFGHFLVGLKSLKRGLGKIELRTEMLEQDLTENPEVLTEAIQTILRKNGDTEAYEKLKTLSRGKRTTLNDIQTFIAELKVDADDKERLLSLTPAKYVGKSEELVERTLQ